MWKYFHLIHIICILKDTAYSLIFVQLHPFVPVKKQEQKQVETDRSLDSLKSFVQSDQQNKQRDLGETQT